MKAPSSCPNSSLSSKVSGKAAQLMATNGRVARGLALWMACANSSLPVPLSPVINTFKGVAAYLRALATARSRVGLEPRRLSKW